MDLGHRSIDVHRCPQMSIVTWRQQVVIRSHRDGSKDHPSDRCQVKLEPLGFSMDTVEAERAVGMGILSTLASDEFRGNWKLEQNLFFFRFSCHKGNQTALHL